MASRGASVRRPTCAGLNDSPKLQTWTQTGLWEADDRMDDSIGVSCAPHEWNDLLGTSMPAVVMWILSSVFLR